MKYLYLLLIIFQITLLADEKTAQLNHTNIDTLSEKIIIQNLYPDTLKTFTMNQDSPYMFRISDWITLGALLVTIIGLILSIQSFKQQLINTSQQLNHMSLQLTQTAEQISLMETEIETESYRYYYDKWMENEDGFSRDILKKLHSDLVDDENKLEEIINFIKYLDSQLSYQESRQYFYKYYDSDHTIFKVLNIPIYQEYWLVYIKKLYTPGTQFSNSIDNTIELIKVYALPDGDKKNEKLEELKKKIDEEWNSAMKIHNDWRIKRRAEKKINVINEDKEINNLISQATKSK